MKHKPLLLAAIVPFMAVAAGSGSQSASVDQQQLKNAIPATDLIGQNIQTSDGRDFGEIETIAFKDDGSVAYYEVEPDMEMYSSASAEDGEASGSAAAGGAGVSGSVSAEVDTDEEDFAEMDVDYDNDAAIQLKPDQIRIEQRGEKVSLAVDNAAAMKQRETTTSSTASGSAESPLEADEVIGMEVDLSDEESFGEVEDIMLSEKGDKAVALVIDNWDGANKERRAMPVELKSVDREREVIRYNVSKDQLDEDGNFDLDKYSDDM